MRFENRLQHAFGTIVRLHRIGEDELTARFQHPLDLVEDAGPVAAVQNRILRPDEVEAGIVHANMFEIAVHHGNKAIEPLLLVQLPVTVVLRFADIQTYGLAAERLGEIAR